MESDKPLPGAVNLRFVCQPGCTRCCTQKGFVYVTEQDVERAAQFLGIAAAEFERRYVYRTKNQRRLRIPRQANCSFLTAEGCSIHPVKPVQCRTFPFWPELLEDKREWKKAARWCPGIGKGELIQIEAVRALAQEMRDAYPRMYRQARP